MSKVDKPDWAERLQRSRKREYDKGWADCEAHIIKLLEEMNEDGVWRLWEAIKRLKREQE